MGKYYFDYEIKLKDIINFNFNHWLKSKSAIKIRLISWGILLLILIYIQKNIVRGIIVSIFLIIFSTFLEIFFIPLQVFLNCLRKRNKSMLGRRIVEVNDNYISEKVEEYEQKYNWEEILDIMVNKKNIFIYIAPTTAITIPKNKLENSKEVNLFINELKSKIKK